MSQITFNLPFEEKQQFAKIAYQNDITMAQLLRWFVRNINHNAHNGIAFHIENRQEEF